MGSIAPETRIGAVRLTVPDLARAGDFYRRALGLRVAGQDVGRLALAADSGPPLLELHKDERALPRDPHRCGLFHLAVLVPSRRDLAVALLRLVSAGWRLSGASDHLVSEALYLDDPDGNGIEIYRDRPRSEWTRDDAGQLRMATLPLDLNGLLSELDGEQPAAELPGMPAGTRIGHVHLQVAELRETEAFYNGVLGFEVIVRSYPGALFVAAGGYHHHIGLNTWNSRGAAPAPPGMVGLRSFEVRLPGAEALAAVLARVERSGLVVESSSSSQAAGDTPFALVRDPSGNGVLLTH